MRRFVKFLATALVAGAVLLSPVLGSVSKVYADTYYDWTDASGDTFFFYDDGRASVSLVSDNGDGYVRCPDYVDGHEITSYYGYNDNSIYLDLSNNSHLRVAIIDGVNYAGVNIANSPYLMDAFLNTYYGLPADYSGVYCFSNLDGFNDLFILSGVNVITDQNYMFRMYNPNTGEHFYTNSSVERVNLQLVGWSYEGVAWIAPGSGDPVYRLFNPNNGDHHYTPSSAERDNLTSLGWQYEGIGWYSGGSTPLYRLFNPNCTGSGSHHYTTSSQERDDLMRIGWRYEGIGWYGM